MPIKSEVSCMLLFIAVLMFLSLPVKYHPNISYFEQEKKKNPC